MIKAFFAGLQQVGVKIKRMLKLPQHLEPPTCRGCFTIAGCSEMYEQLQQCKVDPQPADGRGPEARHKI